MNESQPINTHYFFVNISASLENDCIVLLQKEGILFNHAVQRFESFDERNGTKTVRTAIEGFCAFEQVSTPVREMSHEIGDELDTFICEIPIQNMPVHQLHSL